MSRDELLGLYAGAKVVIVQGGPGSILDAREVGMLPIAVPRRPENQEVVDGHQIAFTRTMELHGEAIAANTEQELRTCLESALRTPEQFHKSPRIGNPEEAAHFLGEEIEKMLGEPRHPEALRRAWRLMIARRNTQRNKPENIPQHQEPPPVKKPVLKLGAQRSIIQNRAEQ
nr:hypothetical protein [Arthrobacter sp. MYb227]